MTSGLHLRAVEELLGQIADWRDPLRVAIGTDCTVLGWAGVSGYRPRACYAGIGEFSIYLDRAARGRGVGRSLLNAPTEAARDNGYWTRVSRSFPFNPASPRACPARGFRAGGLYV